MFDPQATRWSEADARIERTFKTLVALQILAALISISGVLVLYNR